MGENSYHSKSPSAATVGGSDALVPGDSELCPEALGHQLGLFHTWKITTWSRYIHHKF